MSRCPGHMRHWFSMPQSPGLRTPVCVRCGAKNPRPLSDQELFEMRDKADRYPREVPETVRVFLKATEPEGDDE